MRTDWWLLDAGDEGWDEIGEGGQKAQTALPVGHADVMYSELHIWRLLRE